jgi:hypothetical protein
LDRVRIDQENAVSTMNKRIAFTTIIWLGMSATPSAFAWISFLDFNDQLFPPDPPWSEFFNEGSADFVDLGAGNFALRMDSPDHTSENPVPGTYYNEYYVTDIPGYEKLGAARFRLESFTPTGKENLLAVSTPVAAPTITLVDGNYWIWSYLSAEASQPILNLGPAVAGEFHEVYILTTVTATDDMGMPTGGGAKVWWDGEVVYDGPVDSGEEVNLGGYVEFGSGTYWQVNAGTVVDFDWVGFGDVNDFPVTPGITGDYNNDAAVNAADYVVWRELLGTDTQLDNEGEGVTPGIVTPEDYNTWRMSFANGSSLGSTSSLSAVPEPTMFILTIFCVAILGARRKMFGSGC